MNLVARIQNLCDENGITVKQLGENVKLGNGVIGKWGTSSPKLENLLKVAEYFNVSLDYLVGTTDIRSSPLVDAKQACDLATLIEQLLEQLKNPDLTYHGQPLDVDLVVIMQKMFESNMEVLSLITAKKEKGVHCND